MRRIVLALTTILAACGGGPPASTDAGIDAEASTECVGAGDGTVCGAAARICIGEVCVASVCGDGVLDDRTEQCDDGNTVAFDGCESTCALTCTADATCDDGNPCNGVETCPASHACTMGSPLADASPCTTAEVATGVCGSEQCLPAGCGNGVLESGEACDDGNDDPVDGCTAECAFTCTLDADCQNATVCDGSETCELATHRCTAGTTLSCDDGSACTTDACDGVLGCTTTLVDADGDGHAPDSLGGGCGDDCDDTRADVYTGAEELCDGRDNNCNGSTDESAPTWYVDCDDDGFAADTSSSRMSCAEPAASAAGCSPGGWTTVRPVDAATTDCAQTNPAISPGATEIVGDQIDQNCDTREICFLDDDDDGFRRTDGRPITSTDLDCLDTHEARSSEPATDCCDTDPRAFPGQTSFFTAPRTGCGDFDYDCNGALTLQHTTVRGRCACSLVQGWNSTTAAACGVTAQYWGAAGTACQNILGTCIAVPGIQTQGCR